MLGQELLQSLCSSSQCASSASCYQSILLNGYWQRMRDLLRWLRYILSNVFLLVIIIFSLLLSVCFLLHLLSDSLHVLNSFII